MHYYKSPLNPHDIGLGNSKKCKEGDSIAQHIMIILCTQMGEMPSLPDYGCKIWDYQFQIVKSRYAWETDVSDNLEKTLLKYETRLIDIVVDLHIIEVEITHKFRKYPDIKKKATVMINAKLASTKESFSFTTDLFLSPISK